MSKCTDVCILEVKVKIFSVRNKCCLELEKLLFFRFLIIYYCMRIHCQN